MKIIETLTGIINQFVAPAPKSRVLAQPLWPDAMVRSESFASVSDFSSASGPTPPTPKEHVPRDSRVDALAAAFDAYETEANKRSPDKQHLAHLGEAIWGTGCGSLLAYESTLWCTGRLRRDLLPDRDIENAYSRDLMCAQRAALDAACGALSDLAKKGLAGPEAFRTWRAGLQTQIDAADKLSGTMYRYGRIRDTDVFCDAAIDTMCFTRKLSRIADAMKPYALISRPSQT